MTPNKLPHEYNPEILFADLQSAITRHGEHDYNPQDPNVPEPHNGTLQKDGSPSFKITFEPNSPNIPALIRAQEVDKLHMVYSTETLLDGQWCPEAVRVAAHNPDGFSKEYSLRKMLGGIIAEYTLEADEQSQEEFILNGLSPEREEIILADMFAGRRHHMDSEGPEAEYARRIHINMTPATALGVDDYSFLSLVARAYKA